jgi:hypothetical protein
MILSPLIGPTPPLGYIDPGTGSIILQSIVGGFAALLVAIGMSWKQLKSLALRLLHRHNKKEQE